MNSFDMQYQPQPAPEQPAEQPIVQRRADQCFCRDCGQLVDRSASVCMHCGYVLNPVALQQAEFQIRQRMEKTQSKQRIINIFRMIAGEQPLRQPQLVPASQRYRFQTRSDIVYCTNCGKQVEAGASVCVRCQYVLNPEAVKRAQRLVHDRTARLSRKDLIKSLLIPGYGRKMYKLCHKNRPQIAKPCRIAGRVNLALLVTLLLLIIFL